MSQSCTPDLAPQTFKAPSEYYNTLQRHVHRGKHPELDGLDTEAKKEKIRQLWEQIKRIPPSQQKEAVQEIVNKYKIPPEIQNRKRRQSVDYHDMPTPNAPKRLKTNNGSRHSLPLPPLMPPPLLNEHNKELKLEPLPIHETTNNHHSKTTPMIPLPYPENPTKKRRKKSNEQKFADIKKRILKELMYDKLCDMIHISPDMSHWYCTLCRKAGIKSCAVNVCYHVETKRIKEHCLARHHVDRLDAERKQLNAERVRAGGSSVKQTKTMQRNIHSDYNKALAVTAKYERDKYVNSLKVDIVNKEHEIAALQKQNKELLHVLKQSGIKHENGQIINEHVKGFKDWLFSTVKLPQYFDKFLSDGFDDMMVIIETMNEGDLMRIGINKTGHRRKLMIFIKRLREAQVVNVE